MQEYEDILIDAQGHGEDGVNIEKPSITAILAYSEGGYFGDTDIFAQRLGYAETDLGRDMLAVSEMESTIFVLPSKVLALIEKEFFKIYKEMRR